MRDEEMFKLFWSTSRNYGSVLTPMNQLCHERGGHQSDLKLEMASHIMLVQLKNIIDGIILKHWI